MADASRKIKSRFTQSLAFSLALIVAASALGLFLLVQTMREEQSLMRLRFQREEVLQDYMEAMLNQELGFRGFITSIPSDPRFLIPYNQGRQQYRQAQKDARAILSQEGQSAFSKVFAPLEARANDWQQMAQNAIAVLRHADQAAGSATLDARMASRIENFDAFSKAFHTARLLNQDQTQAQEQEHARDRILEGLFALGIIVIGVGAAVWTGRRTAYALGAQAAQLVDQADRLQQNRQELSAQNEVLQAHRDQLQARNRELRLIGRITTIAASELRLDAVPEAFRGVLGELIPFDRCTICLPDAARATTRTLRIEGDESDGQADDSTQALCDTLVEKVLETRQPLVVATLSELDAADRQRAQAQSLAAAGIESFVMAPLIAHGHSIGTLNCYSRTPDRYDAHTVGLVEQVAGRIAAAVENARLFEEERLKSKLLAVSIQETHHRVKNNLQAVSALLDVQLMEAGETVPRETLERTITQIKAISLIHDMLSHDGEEEAVDVKKAIESLLPLVTLAYEHVTLDMDLAPMFLPMRRMTSLALVVNEIALNSLKHCGDNSCHITVRSEYDPVRGWAHLSLQDNGPGFPPGFDPDRDANIGLQLVTTLVRGDLKGTIAFENRNGARVEIAFPLATPAAEAIERAVVAMT